MVRSYLVIVRCLGIRKKIHLIPPTSITAYNSSLAFARPHRLTARAYSNCEPVALLAIAWSPLRPWAIRRARVVSPFDALAFLLSSALSRAASRYGAYPSVLCMSDTVLRRIGLGATP